MEFDIKRRNAKKREQSPQTLYIVVPCYNEEKVLPETAKQMSEVLKNLKREQKISQNSRILWVNDGSKDNTWETIASLFTSDPDSFSGITLSRNEGHQKALLAGLLFAKDRADVTISIDADLQDDIQVINSMVEEYLQGNDVVYGVRNDRETDTKFKRWTAQTYYKMLGFLGVDIVYNHADYRLMSKQVLNRLEEFGEVNLFLRGMVPLIGYPSASVEYARKERFAGESKYPLKKMLSFAWDGVTSFSVRPMRFITVLGFVVSFISLLFIIVSVVQKYTNQTVPGWSSIMVSLWLLGGLNILSMGVVGEYIGKIYSETKKRPRYFIGLELDNNATDDTNIKKEEQ